MLSTPGSAAEAEPRSDVRWLVERGVRYRDLNGNGKMDPYEDPRAPVTDRVEDLLGRMSLGEKAGLMFQPPIAIGRKGAVVEGIHPLNVAPTTELIAGRHISHFNILMAPGPGSVARWHNSLQKIAERTRLGIPITLSSDPRHAAGFNPATGIKQEGFSHWPSQLGLAAAADEGLAERFGNIVRREFRAIGLRSVLGPMADVATEPRWGRSGATFGEDAELVGRLTAAFVRGLQGGTAGLGPSSVAAMVKHFPGGGPAGNGLDPHFSTGKRQLYPGNHFEYHLVPFRSAIAAGARQIMLSYGIPGGQTSSDVAMAFNSDIVTDLLRGRLGFDGVVSTDWMTVDSHRVLGILKLKDASAWGVEHLKVPERYARAIEAGVDQFGGESNAQAIAGLVRDGRIPETRIDTSARRILRTKFELGLFDDPYADADAAASSTGTAEFVESGIEAQRRSLVLLSNNPVPAVKDRPILPLSRPVRLYVEGIDPSVARNYGTVVSAPSLADVAVLRLASPQRFKLSKHLLEYFVPQGSLAFKPGRLARVLACCRAVPTVVDVRLDRPAIITDIATGAAAVLVSFGCDDLVLLDTLFGKFSPTGRLPVDLPSSMAAVEASRTDVPHDTEDPVYEVGWGLSYPSGESEA